VIKIWTLLQGEGRSANLLWGSFIEITILFDLTSTEGRRFPELSQPKRGGGGVFFSSKAQRIEKKDEGTLLIKSLLRG